MEESKENRTFARSTADKIGYLFGYTTPESSESIEVVAESSSTLPLVAEALLLTQSEPQSELQSSSPREPVSITESHSETFSEYDPESVPESTTEARALELEELRIESNFQDYYLLDQQEQESNNPIILGGNCLSLSVPAVPINYRDQYYQQSVFTETTKGEGKGKKSLTSVPSSTNLFTSEPSFTSVPSSSTSLFTSVPSFTSVPPSSTSFFTSGPSFELELEKSHEKKSNVPKIHYRDLSKPNPYLPRHSPYTKPNYPGAH
jgi:hypothetical protein